ncbi:glycosyltransferase family 2 protein [Acetobacter fabarum]|uniref:glycosyltransferase family 2 protein n=1 Tax=Acetobacter fabarum TaxID=483199 RepID=UPI0038D16CD8
MASASKNNPSIRGLKLSRNTGHQTALVAGLSSVPDCDVSISIDADLQDDLLAIRDMLGAWRNGYDIVYGVRNERKTDTLFKRKTAQMFYRLMLFMGVDLIPNHADFRLMDRRALDALLEYRERNLFLRGLVPLIGFPSTSVYYARLKRTAGESKYPLSRMIGLAVQGITSLSVTPLRIIALIGLLISSLAILAIAYALISKETAHAIPGWTSVTIAIFFMGGVQMLSLGIIGDYIGKIYLETKRRPLYHVENLTWAATKNDK